MEVRDGEPCIPCFYCGNCCTSYQVLLEEGEARRLAEALNIDLDTFIARYADSSWPIGGKYLLRHQGNGCIFLKHEKNLGVCSIHEFKPQACRDWTPGVYRPECRAGMQRMWQLTFDQDGKLQGSEADKQRFREFLRENNIALNLPDTGF
jgi:Fe-S-cluster containining protein